MKVRCECLCLPAALSWAAHQPWPDFIKTPRNGQFALQPDCSLYYVQTPPAGASRPLMAPDGPCRPLPAQGIGLPVTAPLMGWRGLFGGMFVDMGPTSWGYVPL
jgi:hypothetical protein